MIDDMMQTALNLDVDAEIARRVALAREMAAETQKSGAESMSRSVGVPKRHSLPVDESAAGRSAASKSGSMDRRKKVQFREEEVEAKQSLTASGKKDSMAEDSIAESIAEGSFKDSSVASHVDRSSRLSSSKQPRRAVAKDLDEIKEDSDSLDRDPEGDGKLREEVDGSVEKRSPSSGAKDKDRPEERSGTYTEDFIAESIASGSSETKDLKSASVLQSKVEDSAGYSEAFDEISQSHNLTSGKPNLKPATIEPVKEEDSAFIQSSQPSDRQVSVSLDDKEVLESARSVDW